ncbi:glycosyltransferase family 4 protein [Jidongwangia harbinensis]|uniref:glycosyltransferase family 4 protein n=1 Tax=Jidongwangia harbinensis TaxID=2878561 RepID=UPI001CD99F28|nr:glycosyltransferase family 4 protein [Jidongwangia harbinensis]MCA2215147.1 glycosyltransferase family 4 protein [Jidongwangia harbinensis]
MLTRRAIGAVRRLPRRAAYGMLGGVLAATLIAVAATRSWAALTAALAVLPAGLALVLVELRRVRAAVRRLLARAVATRERLAEHRRQQAALATELYDQSALLGREFPADLGPLVLRNLVGRGDALEAYRLTRRGDLAAYPLWVVRRLRDHLQRRGYYRPAAELAEFCVAHGGTELDHRVRTTLRGEIAVLSGEFVPAVPSGTPEAPVPGRVLHLVGKSLPRVQAGYTLRTHYIATAQRDAGLDPHVVTRMGFTEGAGTEVVDGIAYHRVAGPDYDTVPHDAWLAAHVTGVAALVRELRPAVLHAASDYTNALTAVAIGRAYGIPVVYESRGFWEETWLSRSEQRYGWDLARLAERHGLPDLYLGRREIEDRMRRQADRVVTLAEVMADRIVAGGVPRDRIEVVPNAVDVDAFPVLRRNADLAGRLGLAPGTVVLGYISSLAEYEGIDTLVAAYARVKATAPATALLIVGDGAVRADLEAAARDLPDVHFTGQVPHHAVLDYYSLIDIFVVPRRPVEVCHLVTPLKPFEAFATGRTVVLSDVRALASIAAESGAAELFRAGDVESLAGVLRDLIADPDRRRRLADAGAAWVRAERTWAANARIYQRVYAELTGAPLSSAQSGA